jgi:hypothetical protein
MEQKQYSFTDFIQQEHFDLSSYIAHLFQSYKINFNEDENTFKLD